MNLRLSKDKIIISLQEQLQKILLANSVQKLEITLLNYELERNRTKISK
nr:MAG TPA: hypothetical protein [Caudoviricetes sp.]